MSHTLEQEDRESNSAGSNASGSNDVGAVRSGMAGAASPPGSKKQGGSILYRRQFTLDESVVSGQQYFLYLDFPGKVTCWVNGQQAYSPEDDPAAAMTTPRGIERNITSLLRATRWDTGSDVQACVIRCRSR